MRVGGRLQMTKMCVFCLLFHSNGRRETEGEKGGGGEFDDAKWEKEGGGRGGRTGGADTNSELIPSELQPVGRRINVCLSQSRRWTQEALRNHLAPKADVPMTP